MRKYPTRSRVFTSLKSSETWSKIIEAGVVSFSDQQAITGIAILVSAFTQIKCGLQCHYYKIAVDLALFSSITHLTTLTCLRNYLQQRPAIRTFKLASMGVLAILLSVAIGSTGYTCFDEMPAWCLFGPRFVLDDDDYDLPAYNYLYIVLTLFLLAFGYLSRIARLFGAGTRMRQIFRTRPSNIIKEILVSWRSRTKFSSHFSRFCWIMSYRCILTTHCVMTILADLYGSQLWEV